MSRKFLRERYPSTAEYNFPRCRGMVFHKALEFFIQSHIPNLQCAFADDINRYTLWHQMHREMYRSIIYAFNFYRIQYPQIREWIGSLFLECMLAGSDFINRIFNITQNRLEKGHLFEHIMQDITPLLQEQTMLLRIKQLKLFFKPDWIEFELNRGIIVDYKTGTSTHHEGRDRFQICLFAWCYARYRNIQIEKCVIYYLNQHRHVEIPWTPNIEKEIEQKIELFLNHLISNLIS